MRERKLARRLARLRENHSATWITLMYCEPFGRPRWHVDANIHHLGGNHRIGSATTLSEALGQAEKQVPGTTIPLHTRPEDNKTCRACPHFRVAHGRDWCRQPGCDCQGFTTERLRTVTDNEAAV